MHFLIFLYINSSPSESDEWFINERNYFIETYGISGRHFDKGLKSLEKKEYIFKKIAKVEDKPTMHIKINTAKLLEMLVFNNMQKMDRKSVKNHENTGVEHGTTISANRSKGDNETNYVKNHENTELETVVDNYDAQIRKQKSLNYEKLFNPNL